MHLRPHPEGAQVDGALREGLHMQGGSAESGSQVPLAADRPQHYRQGANNMNPLLWFLSGLVVLPILVGLAALWSNLYAHFDGWVTRRVDLRAKKLAFRRSLITGLTIELLDATHVRAIKLPFSRALIIRSNPPREYDFIGQEWVVIGDDYNSAREVIGKGLDELGYTEDEPAKAT